MSAQVDEYGFAKRRIDGVQRVSLIAVQTTEGAGVPGDPVHRVTRYYNDDGKCVATSDPGGGQ